MLCPCCSEDERKETAKTSKPATGMDLPGLMTGPPQEFAQELPAANPLPGHLPAEVVQIPPSTLSSSSKGQAYAAEKLKHIM